MALDGSTQRAILRQYRALIEGAELAELYAEEYARHAQAADLKRRAAVALVYRHLARVYRVEALIRHAEAAALGVKQQPVR